jgi:N-acetylmuramoyl-L-alanine amidase
VTGHHGLTRIRGPACAWVGGSWDGRLGDGRGGRGCVGIGGLGIGGLGGGCAGIGGLGGGCAGIGGPGGGCAGIGGPGGGCAGIGGGRAGSGPGGRDGLTRQTAGRKVAGIDPGHNGRNGSDPAYINHLIWNGREWETCDTTGTETNGGYTEARFNFNVATYLRRYPQRAGAREVLTRHNNHGVGPRVNRRSPIINHAHANVGSIFTPPGRFQRLLRAPGLISRDNLAWLNLTTVPKVLIETGNMRNATDARLLNPARFQRKIARALEAAIIRFLR